MCTCCIRCIRKHIDRANSVYVDASRGDNVQGILDAIDPFWAKWGLEKVLGAQVFLCGNPDDLSATSQRTIFTKFGHETYFGVPSRNPERHFGKFLLLGVICPQNLKSKVGQTGTSLRAGYRSRDALQTDTVYSTL